jgi:arylsulfatase A-like enzyme
MNRRTFLLGSLAGVAAAVGAGSVLSSVLSDDSGPGPTAIRRYGTTVLRRRKADPNSPNVLFMSIDDCNDWLGFLNNHPGTHTPNLDALARKSLVFTRAYCAAPMCLPSRTPVLFGRAPYRSHVYDHSDESFKRYQQLAQATSSLVDDLWAAGYETLGAGKVFHIGESDRWMKYRPTEHYVPGHVRRQLERAGRYDPDWVSPYDGQPIGRGERFNVSMIDFGPSGVAPHEEPDGESTQWVLRRLREDRQRPFFLALGLILPHEPWRLPKRFFDLHPLEEVVVPEFRPDDLQDLGVYARDRVVDQSHRFEVLRASGLWEESVQAYQAAISFADDRLGRVLEELARSRYHDDTMIVLWSDHGYHLGEKLHIEKFTLWERATRVPLLLHVPGRFDRHQEFNRPVSLLDLGPTVADLAGVEIHAPHDGTSLLPLVAEPALADDHPPIMTWLSGNHAVRRGPWRYIRYRTGNVELYDHRTDPDEYDNLAGRPEYAATQTELDAFLPRRG